MDLNGYLLLVLATVNLVALPHCLFLLVTSLAAIFSPRRISPAGEIRSRLLIVIPAHNEEACIASTVKSCLAADYPPSLFSVIVIADNCLDRTSAIAAEAGARVVERQDTECKSKGFAIEFLIAQITESGEFDRLDALVIVDADTVIDLQLLRSFDRDLQRGRDWIQCFHTVRNHEDTWRTQLMAYSFSLLNGVLMLGLNTLGTSASLQGNGMCLTTSGLRRIPYASHGLVENMEHTWTLRVAGEFIYFDPWVQVESVMLGSGGIGAVNQRRRWEFGRREIRARFFAPLVRSSRLAWWQKMLSLCELTLPSSGWILMSYVVLTIMDVLAQSLKVYPSWIPVRGSLLVSALTLIVTLGSYGVSPFLVMRLPWKYLATLAFLPTYLVWKMCACFRGQPREWIRTERVVAANRLNPGSTSPSIQTKRS